MIRVGVTGTMGSGKTTLCRIWEELGARVVYADKLAKELMESDEELKSGIRKAFGEGAYRSDGSLDRDYLAREAFATGRVEELNRIVHPRVRQRVIELMVQAESEGAELFVQEAALLLLDGRPEIFDTIILVRSDPELQIERVRQRDGLTRQEVLARLDNQPSVENMALMADVIVENDSTRETFRRRCAELYHTLTDR